jgi:cytochrome c nitrite reductase small subunit
MLKSWIYVIIPPPGWRLAVTIIMGVLVGLGAYVIYISNAASYLSDNPTTCVNCHVMNPQYATWFHSSHRERATCNDCHVPHNNAINKYYFKAKDGMRHATIFTLRNEPQVIFIKEEGAKAVQKNCIRCHNELITDNRMLSKTHQFDHFRTEGRYCWTCHREVPHGRVNSLSSTPNAQIPKTKQPIPLWIQEVVKIKNK